VDDNLLYVRPIRTWSTLLTFVALVLYSVGSVLPVFTMSLVKTKSIAGQDCSGNAQDYSIVMLARSMGSLIGLPIMTVAWYQGIGLGGAALGMPYFLSAVRFRYSKFPSESNKLGFLSRWLPFGSKTGHRMIRLPIRGSRSKATTV
jgi:hypothetical protein